MRARLAALILAPTLACSSLGETGITSVDAGRDGGSGDAALVADGRIASDGGPECGEIIATVRDFRASHPDMEANLGALQGIVAFALGGDGKPVYAPAGATAVTAGAAEFDQWYRDVDTVNMAVEVPIPITETSPGVYLFDDDAFFPVDGLGFADVIDGHNFHFTTEIHTTFEYQGGEAFTFTGDDDVFVFVNRRLALDLGGVHGSMSATIDFDAKAGELGISPGGHYELDVFHAERHTTESHFRIETSIDCFIVVD